MDFSDLLKELDVLSDCDLCPHRCHVNRFKEETGYCRTGAGFSISSICIHRGEEPVISGSEGICNIFFTHCNLQCVYCQNHQISRNTIDQKSYDMSLEEVIRQVTQILAKGINCVGFVSPSHVIPQMKVIMKAIRMTGYSPTWIYNSNGYDLVETLRSLDGDIDVYLPDFKYMDSNLASALSESPDYPAVASAAIREMYRQKGANLMINDQGYAESGLLIRHLVLPGAIENSLAVMRFLAQEISPRLYIGLMAQYYPAYHAYRYPNLHRTITAQEYELVVQEMDRLGLDRGFIQDLDSFDHYCPDFDKNHPFEMD